METAAERAARAVETSLTRASIRQYQRDIMAIGRKGAGKVMDSGMRTDELEDVRDAMEAIRENRTPEEVAEKVNQLLDEEQALLERI